MSHLIVIDNRPETEPQYPAIKTCKCLECGEEKEINQMYYHVQKSATSVYKTGYYCYGECKTNQ